MTNNELLILEGTDPEDWPPDVEISDATLDRMAGACSDATLARMAGVCSGATLDRMAGVKKLIDSIAPLKSIYKQILDKIEHQGCKLRMDSWHTCKTTHCIGGWITTLAGKEGSDLERRFSTETAARFILRRSAPEMPMPNFYATDEAAMAFVRAMALREGA